MAVLIYPSLQQPVLTPEQASRITSATWLPWSEPVRFKLGAIPYWIASGGVWSGFTPRGTIEWYAPWRGPPAPKLGASAYLVASGGVWEDFTPPIIEVIAWFAPFSNPTPAHPGLQARFQQTLAYHPRILPTPDVTLILDATEVNTDEALFALLVYDSVTPATDGTGAAVSIIEIQAQSGAALSIEGE